MRLVRVTASMESPSNEKRLDLDTSEKDLPVSNADMESTTGDGTTAVLRNERDIVTHIISVEDDPSLNPWTFRSFLIGIGLSAFGVVLGRYPSLQRGITVVH